MKAPNFFSTGEPGIKSLACDWLNGNLYWTNQRMEAIYVQAADGKSHTTLLRKNIRPSDLVLLPVARYVFCSLVCFVRFKFKVGGIKTGLGTPSLMFWINDGPGDRLTIEKSWMDGKGRSCLMVLTAQSAHSLTADVAARRLFWVSDFKKVSEG